MKRACFNISVIIIIALLANSVIINCQDSIDNKMKLLDLKLQLLDSKLELLDSKIKTWESKPEELDIKLEELDDVNQVTSNADFPDAVIEKYNQQS